VAEEVGCELSFDDLGIGEQLNELDSFDGGAERNRKMPGEARGISEGITFRDIELDAQRGSLKLGERGRCMRTPVLA
jgi:hypothetical protein